MVSKPNNFVGVPGSTTITVTVKDAGGAPISNQAVTLAHSGSSGTVTITPIAGGITNSSGVATFTVSDSAADGSVAFIATDTTGTSVTIHANRIGVLRLMATLRSPSGRTLEGRLAAGLDGRAVHRLARRGRSDDGTRDQAGAVMILALLFLIVVGGLVSVLATSVASHLQDSTAFSTARSMQYAATSAVDLAIQDIRYAPMLGTSPDAERQPA